jgi:hypothetical protein
MCARSILAATGPGNGGLDPLALGTAAVGLKPSAKGTAA